MLLSASCASPLVPFSATMHLASFVCLWIRSTHFNNALRRLDMTFHCTHALQRHCCLPASCASEFPPLTSTMLFVGFIWLSTVPMHFNKNASCQLYMPPNSFHAFQECFLPTSCASESVPATSTMLFIGFMYLLIGFVHCNNASCHLRVPHNRIQPLQQCFFSWSISMLCWWCQALLVIASVTVVTLWVLRARHCARGPKHSRKSSEGVLRIASAADTTLRTENCWTNLFHRKQKRSRPHGVSCFRKTRSLRMWTRGALQQLTGKRMILM